ncbi:MAG: hypothetical protein HY286_06155 [Planctomycetes bacterium]|nr:hypothetical protein [Planctomycetota bacterium]
MIHAIRTLIITIASVLSLFLFSSCSSKDGTPGKPRTKVASEGVENSANDGDDDEGDEDGDEAPAKKVNLKSGDASKMDLMNEYQFVNIDKFNFDTDEAGGAPAGWAVAETGGRGIPATWKVEKRTDASSGDRVLRIVETRNSGSTFNLLIRDKDYGADLAVRAMVHAESGVEDQGGGLVWRLRDSNNYYVARWNPLENNLRVYKVEGGKRTMFKSVDVAADASKWHAIEAIMRGSNITIRFDNKTLMACGDSTFPSGGKIGFWTKADAATSFDSLELDAVLPVKK